jgi:hypothetical protein
VAGSSAQRSACELLAQAAGRIGGEGHSGGFAAARGVRGEVHRRRLGDARASVQIDVILRTSWAETFAGVLITQAGEFVAAADAITITCFGSRLNGDKRHSRQILRFQSELCKRGVHSATLTALWGSNHCWRREARSGGPSR